MYTVDVDHLLTGLQIFVLPTEQYYEVCFGVPQLTILCEYCVLLCLHSYI